MGRLLLDDLVASCFLYLLIWRRSVKGKRLYVRNKSFVRRNKTIEILLYFFGSFERRNDTNTFENFRSPPSFRTSFRALPPSFSSHFSSSPIPTQTLVRNFLLGGCQNDLCWKGWRIGFFLVLVVLFSNKKENQRKALLKKNRNKEEKW